MRYLFFAFVIFIGIESNASEQFQAVGTATYNAPNCGAGHVLEDLLVTAKSSALKDATSRCAEGNAVRVSNWQIKTLGGKTPYGCSIKATATAVFECW